MKTNKFKKALDVKEDTGGDLVRDIKDALNFANISYEDSGRFEIVAESESFLNNVNQYMKRLDELIGSEHQETFISYNYLPDHIFIRIRFN